LFSIFFAFQLFFFSGYVGVEDLSFLMKGIFFFLTGEVLVPVDIELVQGFGLPPSSLHHAWNILAVPRRL